MNIKITTLTILLALSTISYARIGETPAQCGERYGRVVEVDELGTHYSKHGFTVVLRFHKGRCVMFSAGNIGLKPLSNSEIAMFLTGNAEGWGKPTRDGDSLRWNGRGVHGYLFRDIILYVFESSYIERLKREAEEKERQLMITF